MSTPSIPVARYLVAEVKPLPPEGFTLIDEPIVGGLPFTLQLDAETRLVVTMPNGLGQAWRDADPTSIVSKSDDQMAATAPGQAEPIGDVTRPPLRFLIMRSGEIIASVPLVVGVSRTLPDGGENDRGARVEVVLMSWDLRAGSLRGPGDFGSRVTLAWRRADGAVSTFSPPPVNPYLLRRLPDGSRMESTVGVESSVSPRRFRRKKVLAR